MLYNTFMKRFKLIVSAIFLVLLMTIYPIYDFIDNNQKITISCMKNRNICSVTSEKIILGTKNELFDYDILGDAYLHTVGCSKGISCYYNIRIPHKNYPAKTVIKLYSSSENKKMLIRIIDTFNNYKNNSPVNSFTISTGEQPFFISLLNLYTLLFWLLVLILLFVYLIKKYLKNPEQKDKK